MLFWPLLESFIDRRFLIYFYG